MADGDILTIILDFFFTYGMEIILFITAIIAFYFAIREHKWRRLELVPHCILRPTAYIKELVDDDSGEKTGNVWLITNIFIQRTGGVITYPRFHYILTFKNSEELRHDTLGYTQMTTLLDSTQCGPWDSYITMTKEQSESIESLYLALECKDREEKNCITINKFDFVKEMWQVKRSIIKTKRKRLWHKGNIHMFVNNPRMWITKYGEKGTAVNE